MLEFKEKGNFPEGAFFIINKPLKWTSFDLVNRLKYAILHENKGKFKKIKIGHAGTLDPLATGVVIVCAGRYTKRIEEFQGKEKEYVAELKMGATTPCYDAEQEEDAHYPTAHITEALIKEKLTDFQGDIMQKPPLFSAIKIKGKRAYDIAREGNTPRLEARPVHISEIEILSYKAPFLKLCIVCGKGTYIRSIARDLGKSLDSGAYLTELIRTRIGDYTLEKASSIDECLDKIKKKL